MAAYGAWHPKWRWHPYPMEDVSAEPKTLVTFRLSEIDGGTLLTVKETGFDRLFAHRRQPVREINHLGWQMQLVNLAQYIQSC